MTPRTAALPWAATHPHITFHYDTRSLGVETWVLLGECSSKIEHVSGVPLRPGTAERLNEVFLAKGVHATTAIEGNTLSVDQVRLRLAGELTLPKSQEYLGAEVDSVIKAYNVLVERIVNERVRHEISPDDLKDMNRLVLDGLELEEGVVPGEYRNHVVTVSDYVSPSAMHSVELVERLCEWGNSTDWKRHVGARFVIPILRSIIAHLYIAWIHPFGDGNGRTARLIEFDILTRAGVPTVSAHLLSDYYNRTRTAYYSALSRARRDPSHFVAYAVQGLADGLREQLKLIREQQLHVAWINFVYRFFANTGISKAIASRLCELAVAISDQQDPVPFSHLRALSPAVAEAYAGKTTQTVRRDIRTLQTARIVRWARGGYAANTSQVEAFLPLVNLHEEGKKMRDDEAGTAG